MRPEIVIQSGHILGITSISFSPDGALAATASADETIRLWDLRAGYELRALTAHEGPVYGVTFSPDGKLLASASYDKTVRIWDVTTGELERVFSEFRFPVSDARFAGTLVAGISQDYRGDAQIRVWRVDDGELIDSWDLKTSEKAHWGAALAPSGDLIATYGEESGGVVLRRIGGSEEPTLLTVPELQAADHNVYPALAFLDNGTELALTGGDDPPLIISLDGSQQRPLPTARKIHKFELRGGGRLAAYAGDAVELWDCSTNSLVETIPLKASVLGPERKLAATSESRVLVIRDVASNREILRLGSSLDLPDFIGNQARCFPMATNPVYPMVASAAPDGCVRLWDLRAGQGPHIFRVGEDFVEALAFNRVGTRLATAGGSVQIWDAWTRELVEEFEIEGGVQNLAFSPDDRYLAAATPDRLTLIDLQKRKPVQVEIAGDGEQINDLAFSRSGHSLVLATFSGMIEFRLDPIEELGRQDVGYLAALTQSPLGTMAVVASQSKWIHGQMFAFREDMRPEAGVRILLLTPGSEQPQTLLSPSQFGTDAAFRPDGRRLALACAEGTVNLWDLAASDEPDVWDAHAGGVTAVGWLSDGRYLVTAGMDSAVHLWRPGQHSPAATMVSVSDSDYVVVTDDGSYTATRGGLRGVAFRMDNRALSFDQFDLTLNRPDRVHETLGYAYHDLIDSYSEACRRRRRRMGVADKDVQGDLQAPSVELLSDPPALSTTDRSLGLRVRATSPHRPLKSLLVLVNDVPVGGRKGVKLQGDSGRAEHDLEVELSTGLNRIEISALSDSGTESPRETVITAYTGAAQPPTLYVVAVGVSDYERSELNLKYAAKDAADIARAATDLRTNFGAVETLVLVDSKASREAIVDSREFLERAGVDDQVILFFAGHGLLSGSDYYFLPTDFDSGQLEERGVHYDEIEGLFDGLTARRRLVLLDTCHAGEADYVAPAAARKRQPTATRVRSFRHVDVGFGKARPGRAPTAATDRVLAELFSDLRRGAGAFVIAASGASEYAIERETLGNGVFTYCVLEALRDGAADRNKDGSVVVSELHRYVSERVTALTGGNQRPVSRRENLTNDFAVF